MRSHQPDSQDLHEPAPLKRRHFLQGCAGLGLCATAMAQTALPKSPKTTPPAQPIPPVPATPADSIRAWREAWLDLLGPFPTEIPPLAPIVTSQPPIEDIECRLVSFQAGSQDDRVTAYLLVPDTASASEKLPAVICIHSTTKGAGKRATVGLCGSAINDPRPGPAQSRAYGLELARWGYVTLSIDLLCDGDRIPPGSTCYDTRKFYQQYPAWSAVGKNIWDVMRSVDYLRTLDFVDPARIACLGHSLGGHSSLFAAAFDNRIAAVVSNGGQLSWVRNTDHWSRPMTGDRGPVENYVYIPRFRPYIDDPTQPVPVDFEQLMGMVAPRPLLVMGTESEFQRDDTPQKIMRASETYQALKGGGRAVVLSYPGEHNFPPVAKRFSFAWLDRWLNHTPAIPSIWPNMVI